MSSGIGSEARKGDGKLLFSFPILLFFCVTVLKCGTPVRYEIKPKFQDRDIQFSFHIKNKFLSRSVDFRSIRILKIKENRSDLESKCFPADKPMAEVGASDFETFLNQWKTEPVLKVELPSDSGSVSSLSLLQISKLLRSEDNFTGRLSTGYYIWRSISRAQYSFGVDKQDFLFYVDDSLNEIRFCVGAFSGLM